MEITLGLVLLSIMAFVGLIMVGYAVCEKEEDFMVSGVIILLIVLLSTGVRQLNIDGEIADARIQELKILCIKEGHGAIEILDTKVCKL